MRSFIFSRLFLIVTLLSSSFCEPFMYLSNWASIYITFSLLSPAFFVFENSKLGAVFLLGRGGLLARVSLFGRLIYPCSLMMLISIEHSYLSVCMLGSKGVEGLSYLPKMVYLGCGVRLPGYSLKDLPNEWKIGFSSIFYLPFFFSIKLMTSLFILSLAFDSELSSS